MNTSDCYVDLFTAIVERAFNDNSIDLRGGVPEDDKERRLYWEKKAVKDSAYNFLIDCLPYYLQLLYPEENGDCSGRVNREYTETGGIL